MSEVAVIDLSNSQVTDVGFAPLLKCKNVTMLVLGSTPITNDTVRKWGAFPKLEYVALENSKVDGAELSAISKLTIQHLALEDTELVEPAFKAMGKMTSLKELWLNDSKFDPAWLKHLAGCSRLTYLDLMKTFFGDSSATAIAKLPAINDLTLNSTQIGDEGLKQILKIPTLKMLDILNTKVSKESYLKAQADYSNIEISY